MGGNNKKKSGRNDRRIGSNLHRMRLLSGLSQKDVAAHLGVAYQQVQKYERGESRLSASMLHELTTLFRAPYEQFFDGLVSGKNATVSVPAVCDDVTLKIIAALSGISDPALKIKIGKIVGILAAG